LKVTVPPALALPKMYRVEVLKPGFRPVGFIPLYVCVCLCVCLFVRVHARARACMPASGKIGGFFWKNKIKLHSGLRIKYSKCLPLFRKHNRSLHFQSFLI